MLTENKKEKKNSFSLLVGNLFGTKQRSIFEEEQIQSPTRTIVKNFLSNKLSMTALCLFLGILLFVIIAPKFFVLDLGYNDPTQQNIKPIRSLMDLPSGLKGNVKDIAIGAKFGVGADKEGKLYVWGDTRISNAKNIADVPEIIGGAKLVAAGYDHAVVVDGRENIYVWGNDRNMQAKVPEDIYNHGNIVQIEAGYQMTLAVTDQNYVFAWGNENLNDTYADAESTFQGKIVKVAATNDSAIGLTTDGEVVHVGLAKKAISNIPASALKGVVDIASGNQSVAALKEDGTVLVWGNATKGEQNVPEFSSKPVKIYGGSYHYVALLEDGSVAAWGSNLFGQSKPPSKATNATNIKDLSVGYYQNYAITDSGETITWGLKGYVLGTDDFGRDILNRLVNGGKLTMTIGAVSVAIATIIGVSVGAIAGFFGGKIDMLLMRVAEIILALPFLPFAMILSSVIGNSLTEMQRIYLIMVVLGLLSWAGLARIVRAQVLAEREKEFVTAAKAMGVKEMAIVFKHIVPNVISIIIVNATLTFASSLLTESTLSYLGFGVKLPRPTWGNMLYGANNSVVIQTRWWQWVFPAIILSVCVICINTIGDGLRDAIDPKSQER